MQVLRIPEAKHTYLLTYLHAHPLHPPTPPPPPPVSPTTSSTLHLPPPPPPNIIASTTPTLSTAPTSSYMWHTCRILVAYLSHTCRILVAYLSHTHHSLTYVCAFAGLGSATCLEMHYASGWAWQPVRRRAWRSARVAVGSCKLANLCTLVDGYTFVECRP